MTKMTFFFAGARRGKDCDPRDAVGKKLDIMTTFFTQRTKRKRKNKFMTSLIKERTGENKS